MFFTLVRLPRPLVRLLRQHLETVTCSAYRARKKRKKQKEGVRDPSTWVLEYCITTGTQRQESSVTAEERGVRIEGRDAISIAERGRQRGVRIEGRDAISIAERGRHKKARNWTCRSSEPSKSVRCPFSLPHPPVFLPFPK